MLGLIACGGSEESESNGDDSGGPSSNTLIEISALSPADADVNRVLVGSSHSLERSLYVSATSLTNQSQQVVAQIGALQLVADSADIVQQAETIKYSLSATSSDPSVIAIQDGKLKALTVGKAQITLTIESDFVSIKDNQASIDLGEVTVCPYDEVALTVSDGDLWWEYDIPNHAETQEITSIMGGGHGGSPNFTATPIISETTLSAAGLTTEDCPTYFGEYIYENLDENRYINQVVKGLSDQHYLTNPGSTTSYGETGSRSDLPLLGLDFSNISLTVLDASDISNVRITEIGYDNQLANFAPNPIKVMGFSESLNRDVDITADYIRNGNQTTNVRTLEIFDVGIGDCHYGHCIPEGSQTTSITLSGSHLDLPDVTSATLPVVEPTLEFDISPKNASVGTIIKASSHLIIGDAKYDSSVYSSYQSGFYGGSKSRLGTSFSGEQEKFANWLIVMSEGSGEILAEAASANGDDQSSSFKVGQVVAAEFHGRWLQADSGGDHYIGAFDPNTYTSVNSNQITYQSSDNKTITLIRAGIENVAVTGSINVIEESSAQANSLNTFSAQSRALTGTPRSLAGIASIDLILKNVNTGEETDVSVAADGTFSEEVPTGEYDVKGTVVDGEITYSINTQITVEKDATNTGKLSLAKVGLYNFDVSISQGCEYHYKCYSGQNYTFTIHAKNTGFIASSGIEVSFPDDLSDNALVNNFIEVSTPTTGAAPGDSITYQVSMSFNQPAQDTIVELPITLTDSENRTWEETLSIPLSSHDPINIEIRAYNDGASANVRGYLMLEGRTPIRVSGSSNTIKVPNIAGIDYELILANQEYNQETPYSVAVATSTSNAEFNAASGIVGKNENADDVFEGATSLAPTENIISYISAGDVDYYVISLPE